MTSRISAVPGQHGLAVLAAAALLAAAMTTAAAVPAFGQTSRPPHSGEAPPPTETAGWPPARPFPIEFERSAEFSWLAKPVLDRRVLDDMTDPSTWAFTGTGTLTFPADTTPDGGAILRVDLRMFRDEPAPTGNGLSAVNLRRAFAGEDWRGYNRLALWIRPEVSGFPMLPLQLVLHNEGDVAVPDAYYREGIHYVTLANDRWQRVVWEIEPLARDRVTAVEFGYWVNKMLAAPGDAVAFEIGGLELERVEPDAYAGWAPGPYAIAFSHEGYRPEMPKSAVVGASEVDRFEVVRVDGAAQPEVMLAGPAGTVRSRLGEFRVLDFSAVREPGRYAIRAGDRVTRPFRIGDDAWRPSVWAALNFFFGERCGYEVPGSHGVCHRDWTAVHGDERIVINGGWHDAGDLSQGLVNTGEATYALFDLAARLRERGDDPALLAAVLDEAKWGLEWVLRVRFPGGHRVGFAGNNLWTNGVLGDADDRTAGVQNNPNVNYIAAAAAALAARVLADVDPELAARSLAVAEEDWRHAVAGTEGPETWATVAYAATPMELAAIGALASVELYDATGKEAYAEKAFELARVVVASQQKRYVGSAFPLAGHFNTGPDGRLRFHQFHRGNDQAPVVALARLIERFPEHEDWMEWYAAVARYSEYQKAAARTTEPWGVLPAYVYHEDDWLPFAEQETRHGATREAFRAQVREGMPMGDGYYLRAFPVWFARRGNYGVLLSQAKALSTAARVRRDPEALELAQRQAQWVIGRNPFAQSTMYGVGYDWAQQYSVSSGDIVGALPVGMQSHGVRDVPYWPAQNMYVYKEVWVHPVSRWLWLMADLDGPGPALGPASGAALRGAPAAGGPSGLTLTAESTANGDVVLVATIAAGGARSLELRTANLRVGEPVRPVTARDGEPAMVRWAARIADPREPWVAVVVPDDDVSLRQEAFGDPRP